MPHVARFFFLLCDADIAGEPGTKQHAAVAEAIRSTNCFESLGKRDTERETDRERVCVCMCVCVCVCVCVCDAWCFCTVHAVCETLCEFV